MHRSQIIAAFSNMRPDDTARDAARKAGRVLAAPRPAPAPRPTLAAAPSSYRPSAAPTPSPSPSPARLRAEARLRSMGKTWPTALEAVRRFFPRDPDPEAALLRTYGGELSASDAKRIARAGLTEAQYLAKLAAEGRGL